MLRGVAAQAASGSARSVWAPPAPRRPAVLAKNAEFGRRRWGPGALCLKKGKSQPNIWVRGWEGEGGERRQLGQIRAWAAQPLCCPRAWPAICRIVRCPPHLLREGGGRQPWGPTCQLCVFSPGGGVRGLLLSSLSFPICKKGVIGSTLQLVEILMQPCPNSRPLHMPSMFVYYYY